MLDDLAYEDSESPAIGVVPAGVSWEEVQDHIKIAHHPLLVPLAERILHRLQALIGRGQRAGVFRADLPSRWLISTCYSVMHAAAEDCAAGRLDPGRAARIITAALLAAFTPPGKPVPKPTPTPQAERLARHPRSERRSRSRPPGRFPAGAAPVRFIARSDRAGGSSSRPSFPGGAAWRRHACAARAGTAGTGPAGFRRSGTSRRSSPTTAAAPGPGR